MPFPLTYRSKIAFPLSNNPDITIQQFYEDASYKISRKFLYDADVAISVNDGKMLVVYTINYKKPVLIITAMVLFGLGVYFLTWKWANPPGLPQTWGRHGEWNPPGFSDFIIALSFMWTWLVGATYVSVALIFRSLLKDTWKRLIIPRDKKDVA